MSKLQLTNKHCISRAGTLPKQRVSKLWLTNKHCISRAGTPPKRPLAIETCNTYTPSSGASVFSESPCGEHSFPSYYLFSHPPTPLDNTCLSSLFPCLSWSINQYHYIRGVLTLSQPSLGDTDPSGAAPWALIPLFLSRVGLAPPLALSLAWASRPLFLLLSCGPCAPSLSLSFVRAGLAPPPPFHVGSAPTSVLCTSGAVPLSPGRSLARDTPRMPKKPLGSVCLTGVSLSMCVMGVKENKKETKKQAGRNLPRN